MKAKEIPMKKIWLLTLLLIGCSSGAPIEYQIYKNVSYYYGDNLKYYIQCNKKEYVINIDNVYTVEQQDFTLDNIFYLSRIDVRESKLVIYK